MIEASMMFAAIFFALYGLACSVECGMAINLLRGDQSKFRRYFTPIWEVTNVFLVFGFTAVAILFNHALQPLSTALRSTLIVALVALLARSCVVLLLFYARPEKLPRWAVLLFALTCYAIPLSMAAAGVYLLIGQLFWYSLAGWLIMTSSVMGLTSTGLLFLNGKSDPKKLFSNEIIFAAWLMILGSFLPLALLHSGSNLQKWPVLALDLLSIVGLFVAYLVVTGKTKFNLKYYAALLTLSIPLLLALANRPWLVNGKLKLAEAFGAQHFAAAFLIGTAIIAPLVIFGLWLFVKLLRDPLKP